MARREPVLQLPAGAHPAHAPLRFAALLPGGAAADGGVPPAPRQIAGCAPCALALMCLLFPPYDLVTLESSPRISYWCTLTPFL